MPISFAAIRDKAFNAQDGIDQDKSVSGHGKR